MSYSLSYSNVNLIFLWHTLFSLRGSVDRVTAITVASVLEKMLAHRIQSLSRGFTVAAPPLNCHPSAYNQPVGFILLARHYKNTARQKITMTTQA
jgi:hypothetical protein